MREWPDYCPPPPEKSINYPKKWGDFFFPAAKEQRAVLVMANRGLSDVAQEREKWDSINAAFRPAHGRPPRRLP